MRFGPIALDVERRRDGAVIVRSTVPLGELGPPPCAALARWAAETPQRTFLAERDGDGWRTIDYATFSARARRVANGLLARGASAERPVAIVAENAIATALVILGAQLAGVPAAPISTAYARDGADRTRFDAIVRDLGPAFVYTDDRAPYRAAFAAHPDLEIVDDVRDLERDAPARDVTIALDSIAKVLFTSGSTGIPKGVITTHRMMAANQAAMSHVWPAFDDEPPVLVDWLPWNHCYGGSLVFNFVLQRGGTLYIDDGRPVPGRFDRTLRNLAEIAPTLAFGVPRTFAMLVPALERDAAFRAHFFSRLRATYSGGAMLSEPLWRALDALGRDAPGGRAPIIVSWGATETAPFATGVHDFDAAPQAIGTPAPGCAIKLAPVDGAFELRVIGPNVTPGYWHRADATAAAFDEDGFYRTGDAGALVDPERPAAGFTFTGRLAENFKLSSGTWVDTHALRAAFLAAAAPLVADVLFTGEGEETVGALVYPAAGAREHPELAARITAALQSLAASATASSRRVARALVVHDDPSLSTGELTDKGSLNRRIALRVRAAEIAQLAAGTPAVIRPEPSH